MQIGNRIVNEESSVFIVAELSANHGGKIEIAKQTIFEAHEAGADAIKLQTYTPDTITLNCNNEFFQINDGTLWDGRTLFDLYQEAYTPWEWHQELFEYARSLGMEIFSTPFDKTAVDLLEDLNTPVYKVASFEITDIPLIEYIASKGKPVIMSTGIASLEDIEEAVQACKNQGNDQVVLLKCTSSYPAPLEDSNLLNIQALRKKFGVLTGFSDHTEGIEAPIVAVALGAKIIEKHFIIDRSIGGPDASFSLDKDQFSLMVKSVRKAETLMGSKEYALSEKQIKNRKFARSLFISQDVKAGEVVTLNNVRSVRPSDGLSPKLLSDVLGRKFEKDYKMGTPLSFDCLSKEK